MKKQLINDFFHSDGLDTRKFMSPLATEGHAEKQTGGHAKTKRGTYHVPLEPKTSKLAKGHGGHDWPTGTWKCPPAQKGHDKGHTPGLNCIETFRTNNSTPLSPINKITSDLSSTHPITPIYQISTSYKQVK